MSNIDLVKPRKDLIEFTPIELPEDADLDRLNEMLEGAEAALFRFKKMLEGVTQANSATDSLKLGSWEYDFMTEECSVDFYEDSALDMVDILQKHLTKQVARFTQYCDDLQACIEDAEQYEADVRKYGSYDDQVRSYFYSTR